MPNEKYILFNYFTLSAAFIRAMDQANIAYRGCGNTSKDGCGYPSSTHVNGHGLDFNYQNNEKDKKVILAWIDFGCSRYFVGTNAPQSNLPLNGGVGKKELHHNNHLHIVPFGNIKITEQKKR